MLNITFIRAGSMALATKLVGDVLSFDVLNDGEIRLTDIDE